MQQKKTIALDFDGPINSYTSGWMDGNPALPDLPTEGAFDFIRTLFQAKYEVVIHSTRARGEGVDRIKRWLRGHGLEEQYVQAIVVTDRKPPAMVYIDDRGFRFEGKWPTVKELAVLETPHKSKPIKFPKKEKPSTPTPPSSSSSRTGDGGNAES